MNQVLGEREQIKNLTYLNAEHLGKTSIDRKAIFDLYCENEKGEKFIIELQNVKQNYFKDRSIFYSTFPIQNQAPKGKEWDYCLKAVYTIGILNFSFPDQGKEERYLREIQLMDKHSYEIFYEKLTFIYLEVPRYKKQESQLSTLFDKWMYVLKNLHKLQERPERLQEKVFEKLFAEAEIAKLSPDDMKSYERSLKIYRDNYSVMESIKSEGYQEGIEKGKQERSIEIAKMLLRNGAAMALIEKTTGLKKEEIEQLKREVLA